MQNVKSNRTIIHASVVSECSLGVNLVIDNFFYVASDSSPIIRSSLSQFEHCSESLIYAPFTIGQLFMQVSSVNAVWVLI